MADMMDEENAEEHTLAEYMERVEEEELVRPLSLFLLSFLSFSSF